MPQEPAQEEKNPQRYPEPTVGGFILNPKGEVLLCRSEKWKDYYTIPGGHIELGERIEDALKREVKEEVGLDVEPVRLLLMQEAIYSEEFHKRRHFIFLDYLCMSKSSDVRVDNAEIQSYIWVKLKEALKLHVDAFTMRLLKEYLAIKSSKEI
jgi:nucleoside triphosphatase